MTADQLLDAVEKDSMERLRWLVLSRFNILPGSKQARELSKEDIIVSGAHMVLDRRPRRRETDAETGGNASFRITLCLHS